MKGSSNGCYTKNISVNQSNAVFDAANTTKNGTTSCTNCTYDGWSAATSNSAEFGEASLREQAFGVDNAGEPSNVGHMVQLSLQLIFLLVAMKYYLQKCMSLIAAIHIPSLTKIQL